MMDYYLERSTTCMKSDITRRKTTWEWSILDFAFVHEVEQRNCFLFRSCTDTDHCLAVDDATQLEKVARVSCQWCGPASEASWD
jgi:hypothetical protein